MFVFTPNKTNNNNNKNLNKIRVYPSLGIISVGDIDSWTSE